MTIILLKELRAEASRLKIPGRSKMNRGDLIEAIADATERLRAEGQRRQNAADVTGIAQLSDGDNVAGAVTRALLAETEAIAADVPSVRAGDVSCVDCHEVFNVSDTAQCATCHPRVTPATVFGGLPRSKFKVTRTSMRRSNVRNRRK